MSLSEILDVIKHSSVSAARRRRTGAEVRALYRPMTTEEVAHELGISKPTVLKWMRAGLLSQARASKETGRLFDREQISDAKHILEGTKFVGTVQQRAISLADMRERLGWATVPDQLRAMRASLDDVRAGKGIAISAEDLAEGDRIRKARLAHARPTAARTKRRTR